MRNLTEAELKKLAVRVAKVCEGVSPSEAATVMIGVLQAMHATGLLLNRTFPGWLREVADKLDQPFKTTAN